MSRTASTWWRHLERIDRPIRGAGAAARWAQGLLERSDAPPQAELLARLAEPRWRPRLLQLARLHPDPGWLAAALLQPGEPPQHLSWALEILAGHPSPTTPLRGAALDAAWERAQRGGEVLDIDHEAWPWLRACALRELERGRSAHAAAPRDEEQRAALVTLLHRFGLMARAFGALEEASAAFHEEVTRRRALLGLDAADDLRARQQAAAAHPEGVRALAAALGALGTAVDDRAEHEEATRLHAEGVALCRLLVGLTSEATAEQRLAAYAVRPADVLQLADGLAGLGTALASSGYARDATGAWAEAAALRQVGLQAHVAALGGDVEALEPVATTRSIALLRGWLRTLHSGVVDADRAWALADALGALGRALDGMGAREDAAGVGNSALALMQALLGAGGKPGAAWRRATVQREPARARALAGALYHLSDTLTDLDTLDATRGHAEEIAWRRLLAGLKADATDAQREAAAAQRPALVRELAWALGRYGVLLKQRGDTAGSLVAHTEEVALSRALAGLPPGATPAHQRLAAQRQPTFTWELSIALEGQSARLARQGDLPAARAVRAEQIALQRCLLGLPNRSRAAQRRQLAAARPYLIWKLATALGEMSELTSRAGELHAARTACSEEVALKRLLVELHVDLSSEQSYSDDPTLHGPSWLQALSHALTRLGEIHQSMGQLDAAFTEWSGAIALERRLIERRGGPDKALDRARELSLLLGRLGLVEGRLERHAAAITSHTEEVALARVAAGLDAAATDAQRSEAAASKQARVRELAIALGNLGNARTRVNDLQGAVDAHAEEVALSRILAGLPPRATTRQQQAAARRVPTLVDELVIALRCLGSALKRKGNTPGAVDVWTEEVRLRRHRLGLTPNATSATRRAAAASQPSPAQRMVVALGRLGDALNDLGRNTLAAPIRVEEVELARGLTGLDANATDTQRREAVVNQQARVRDLAFALGRHGGTLGRQQAFSAAADAHTEEVVLSRLLAGIEPDATPAQLREAAVYQRGLTEELVIALSSLGAILHRARRYEEAALVRAELAATRRALLGLPEAPSEDQRLDAAKRAPALTLSLARALYARGDSLLPIRRDEARSPWEDALALYEALVATNAPNTPKERDSMLACLRAQGWA